MAAHTSGRAAVFLDRDGTLNVDVGYTHRVEDLALIENCCAGLRTLQLQNLALIIVTNQSGIARGYFTEDQMRAFNAVLCGALADHGVQIEAVYHCPFHPEAARPEYRRESSWRKPSAGMLLQAAADHGLDLRKSFVVGDKKSDIAAGKAAGCRTVLVRTGQAGAGETEIQATPDFVADDLLAAAQWIEGLGRTSDISRFADSAYPSDCFDSPARSGDSA